MIVLLEGPDGGGKTYLADLLATRYNLNTVKNSAPDPSWNLADIYRSQLQEDTVIDRAWPSERIYAPILGRKTLVSEHIDAALFGLLKEIGGRMIICLPSFHACKAAWEGREGELFKDEKILKAAWDGYKQLAQSFRADKSFVRVYERTMEGCEEDIYKWLER